MARTSLGKRIRTNLLEVEVMISCRSHGFREFESRFLKYTDCPGRDEISAIQYVTSLLLIDQLQIAISKTGIKLPQKLNALDVGCGTGWGYAGILYGFLRQYNTETPREVHLDGIDLLLTKRKARKIIQRESNPNITPMPGDILNMGQAEQYHFILWHNMLASPFHFAEFGLGARDLRKMMEKSSELLTPDGIQVIIAYQSAAEYSCVVGRLPKERIIAESWYRVQTGNGSLDSIFTPGIDRLYRSGICVARK